MGTTATSNYSGNRTFTATTPGDFNGDPILVEIGASANEVIPLATVGNRIGVFQEKLNNGDGDNGSPRAAASVVVSAPWHGETFAAAPMQHSPIRSKIQAKAQRQTQKAKAQLEAPAPAPTAEAAVPQQRAWRPWLGSPLPACSPLVGAPELPVWRRQDGSELVVPG